MTGSTSTLRAILTREDSPIIIGLRIVVVLLCAAAEIWNNVNMIRDGEPFTEHYGYFTVHANLLVLVVFVWMLVQRPSHRPRWFDALRAAATLYIVMTGLVYAVLLAKPDEVWSWQIAFTNLSQHRVVPVLVAIDWLLVATRRPLRWSTIWRLMIYPVAYLVVAQLRGLVDAWYPYPFMDPAVHGGYAGLLWPTGQVVLAFALGSALVVALGIWRHRLEVAAGPR